MGSAAAPSIIDLGARQCKAGGIDHGILNLHIGDDLWLVVEGDVGVDYPAPYREPLRSRQFSICSNSAYLRALILPFGEQRDGAIESRAKTGQCPGKGACACLLQLPCQRHTGEISTHHVDGQRAVPRKDIEITADRAVIGGARQADCIATPAAHDQRDDIRKADTKTGARCRHPCNRAIECSGQCNSDRPVSFGKAAAVEDHTPAITAIGSRPMVESELRCDGGGSDDAEHAIGAISYPGIDQHLPAEEVFNPGAEQPGRSRADGAIKAVTRSATFKIDIGINVEHADRFNAIAVDVAINATGINPVRHVTDKDCSGLYPVRPDSKIIRKDALVGIGQIAIQTDIGQQPACRRTHPRNAKRACADGYPHPVCIAARLAACSQPFKRGVVKSQPHSGNLVGNGGGCEITVEQSLCPHIVAADIACQDRGAKQADIEREVAILGLAHIDFAFCGQRQSRRCQTAFDLSGALLESGSKIDSSTWRQCITEHPFPEDERGLRIAFGGEQALARRQFDIRKVLVANRSGQRAIPFCPAAFAVQRSPYRCF